MLDNLTLDDSIGVAVSLHETDNRAVVSVDGLGGLPSPRAAIRTLTTSHGAVDETRWLDSRVITVVGEVWGDTFEEMRAELGTIQRAMLQTLDVAPALLKWQWGGSGSSLQCYVKLAGFQAPTLAEGVKLAQYQATFVAADPRAYSQALTTATGAVLTTAGGGLDFPFSFPIEFTPSAGGSAAVINHGDIPSPPILRIYGECSSPQVRLVSTGETLYFSGSISDGDYLEIDCRQRTVKLNGTTSRLNLLDAASSTWFELPTGSDSVRLSSATFNSNARCDVLYRSAYAG